ncbi:MAG: ABC transporter ATP-binding protein [Bernardetiaceae bacterium]
MFIRSVGLSYRYSPESPLLRFPDFALAEADMALLLGASGSGKTTLLHLVAGIRGVQSGEVWIGTSNLATLSEAQRDRLRGQRIGLVFQTPHFIQSLTVLDNLLAAAFLAGMPQDRAYALRLLEQLGLAHKARQKPHRLSQGEQQRAGIARALLNRPALILADEPTASLDDENCRSVAALLQEQSAASGATLLIVTHDGRLKSRFAQQILLTPPAAP